MSRVFPNVLKELMKRNNVTQTALAEVLDVTRQTIAAYLAGTTEPTLSKLRKMAVFFNVPTDYLCGMEPTNLLCFEKEVCARLDALIFEIESIKSSYQHE